MFATEQLKSGTSTQLVYVSQSLFPNTLTSLMSTTTTLTTPNIVQATTNMMSTITTTPAMGTTVSPDANTSTFATATSPFNLPVNRTPQTKFQTSPRIKNRSILLNKRATTPRTPATVSTEARRSSSRSIKRKRFDDEIVEYSVNYPQAREQHRVGRPRAISNSSNSPGTPTTLLSNVSLAGTPSTSKLQTTNVMSSTTASVFKTLPTVNRPQFLDRITQIKTNDQLVRNLPVKLQMLPKTTVVQTPNQMPSTSVMSTTTCHINDTTASLVAGNTEILTSKINSTVATKLAVPPKLATPPKLAITPKLTVMPRLAAVPLAVEAPLPTKPSTLPVQMGTTVATRTRGPRQNNRRKGTLTPRRRKATGRPPNQIAVRDLGRWKPIDDLALVLGVQQTEDLRVVHRSIKFSCRFTLSEIQARWYSLLYEPAISRTAVAAMRNLHPEMIESVQRKALFSVREEEILSYIKSTDHPKLEQFEELLKKNAADFHCQRTAKALNDHWQMMRQYQLLCDQMPKPPRYNDKPISFSDAEDQMLDTDLHDPRDESLEIELAINDRSQKRHIRILDTELSRWNVLIDSTCGTNSTVEFDSQTLAVLRGRLVRYLMRSKEITFGRDAKDQTIDIDLSLEGPAAKISRRQGTIKLRSNGDFFISNDGKRPIYINGVPLAPENKTRLANNFVVEVIYK